MKESTWKGILTGAAGGLVTWWAMDRFYKLAKASSSHHSFIPYCIGAGMGAAYGGLVVKRYPRPIARVPLGAAVYLGDPDNTAIPSKRNLALRLVSKGLKTVLEQALFVR
jgi:hypothetical protein